MNSCVKQRQPQQQWRHSKIWAVPGISLWNLYQLVRVLPGKGRTRPCGKGGALIKAFRQP
jgi:hypothetical protein